MLIQCRNLSKVYNAGRENEVRALTDVTCTIDKGDMCAIIGPSGSGKTTLLRMLGCLDVPTSGTCHVSRIDTKAAGDRVLSQLRNEQIGFVLQEFGLIEDRSVFENIRVPLLLARHRSHKTKERVANMLDRLDIAGLQNKMTSQLSGGQKQRVAIARALINDPGIILADEPTGALDSATARDVMSVFCELNRQGKTIIIVTHNLTIADQCNKVLTLTDGKLG
ncbi:MAG: ABC transporter ATP-binding protein [Clostridia bacterium]